MKHFIIFFRTRGHCVTYLVRAASLRDALVRYITENSGCELLPDGGIRTGDGYGGWIHYSHPLECIESEEKSRDDEATGWEIRELTDAHWSADYAEVFCSANPSEVEHHAALCLPLFRQRFPRSRARAFTWYLKDGPLVTFHRRRYPKRTWPIEVLARYHLPWDMWPKVREWDGTLDDILESMAITYPGSLCHSVGGS
ncbi:MAG TPA: hypothetical protein VK689_11330 [Armatimonadota bacterium]|nr:hypothetical protein [Armatimonadota bacterium]